MSRLYEALRRVELEKRAPGEGSPNSNMPMELLNGTTAESIDLRGVRSAKIEPSATSRLVALTDPRTLGAEKFRSLATRLEHLRNHQVLKSVQVTSSSINEGKSLVSANLALTLALEFSAKVLLVEGDLHRPSLSSRFGLEELTGLTQWWDTRDQDIAQYIYRLNHLPLWFLGAGRPSEQPSQILQSARFAEAFLSLNGGFDWIIVDSTPMSPTIDANLWSRLVDGTLLVVREGLAAVKALKQGLKALDNPKLVGIVLNEASDLDRASYEGQYHALPKKR
jgi:capsular exopolysaccharide synthesis family protein